MANYWDTGVYILIKDFEPIYVGSSIQVELRVKNHTIKDYDYFVIIRTGHYQFVEWFMVYLLQPVMNTKLKKYQPRELRKKHLR